MVGGNELERAIFPTCVEGMRDVHVVKAIAATISNQERTVKKFAFLTYGFERPTPEIMAAWNTWFESIKGNIVDMAGLSGGREISKAGTKDLPMGQESITGFMIVSAESLEDAERMAHSNPYIASIRVYEMMSK